MHSFIKKHSSINPSIMFKATKFYIFKAQYKFFYTNINLSKLSWKWQEHESINLAKSQSRKIYQ